MSVGCGSKKKFSFFFLVAICVSKWQWQCRKEIDYVGEVGLFS